MSIIYFIEIYIAIYDVFVHFIKKALDLYCTIIAGKIVKCAENDNIQLKWQCYL